MSRAVPGMMLCLFAALLLARAAWLKLRDPARFASVLDQYQVLPATWVGALAVGLPWGELGLAVLLPVPSTRAVTAPAAALLFGVFAGAVGINLARGRTDIDCGCGDPAVPRTISRGLVLHNLALAVSLLAILALPGIWPGAAGAALAAAGAGALWLLSMAREVLAGLPRPAGRRSARRVRFAPGRG